MQLKGVITGDIVKSSEIKAEWRELLLQSIQQTVEELKKFSPLQLEFYRGDSIQLIVEKPEEALRIAIMLRAGLKSKTPQASSMMWDVRVSIGIGTIDYVADKVVLSDGDAFHYSGRGFDELGKRRLAIRTPWSDTNDELAVSTAFADEIISNWSKLQAQAIYLLLLHQPLQKELATSLNKSSQSISKLLSYGKESLVSMYLKRFSQIISNKTTTT